MEQDQSLQPIPRLPVRKAVTDYADWQLELYRNLPTNCSVSTMVSTQTPTLAKIRHQMSLTDLRALLSIAVCEVCDFFNVGKNMNDTQVAMTVDLIIEQHSDLKLEEIKYCFRRAMMREKLFDRLDGNIIIGWIRDYDAERTEEAISLSEHDDSVAQNRLLPRADDSVSFSQYLGLLRQKAAGGDEQAAKDLAQAEKLLAPQKDMRSEKEKRREFRLWYVNEFLRAKLHETQRPSQTD